MACSEPALHVTPAGEVLEEPDMLDRSLEAEFESYRKTLSTDEARQANGSIAKLNEPSGTGGIHEKG
jgi:hypothetical protein